MIRRSRKDEALVRMRAANPFTATELRAAIGEEMLSRAMERAIAAGDSPSQPVSAGDRVASEYPVAVDAPRRGLLAPRRRAALGLGAGLACVAAVAAAILFAGGSVGGGSQPAFAAAAIEVAEANPRLLVTAPGWSVTRADEFEADSGEMTFGDGRHELQVTWYPARLYGSYLRDRATVSRPVRSTLLGQRATTVYYGDGADYATMLSPQGSVFVEIRGRLASRAEYEAVVHSLRPVGVDAWLSAMPSSVVRPEARAAVVERMLRGVPLPPGFDAAALGAEDSVSDHYQLAVKVMGAVACGWVESWLAATGTGDRATAQQAVAAMGTAASGRSWIRSTTVAAGPPTSSASRTNSNTAASTAGPPATRPSRAAPPSPSAPPTPSSLAASTTTAAGSPTCRNSSLRRRPRRGERVLR